MGVAPDLGTEVNGREDGRGVYPNIVEDVSMEWGDKMEGVSVKVGNAGDVAEDVPIDELLLWNPKFLTAVIDDGVLMGVPVSDKGTGRSGEEIGEDVG